MKSESAHTPVRLSVIFTAYYAVLVVFLAASFFPEYRLWGVNWWEYFPGYVSFAPCCRMTTLPIGYFLERTLASTIV